MRARRHAYARQRFEGREQGFAPRFYRNGPMRNERPWFDRQARVDRAPARAERPRYQNRRDQGPPPRYYRNGPMRNEQPRYGRRAMEDQAPARAERPRIQNRREPGPPKGKPAPARRQMQRNQRKAMPFDINGDGKLSKAEKAAQRAYRQAMRAERGDQAGRRPAPESQPPAE